MTIPKYIIKENPSYTPIYQLSRPKHCFEIVEGEFTGLIFSFGRMDVKNNTVEFNYDILNLPENIELNNNVEKIIGEILNNLIERGYYEFDTK